MAFLKFNKAELVNLSYSLKREIIIANKAGAYCNTSIVTCNTRRYHGLYAMTLDRFGGDRFMLLSSLDESLVMDGKQFNLGIHCYGDIYEPRGHKYVVDFGADPAPTITYKVGDIMFRKTILFVPGSNQLLIKYEVVSSPNPVKLLLKPFLAFRNIHDLTHQNDQANLSYTEVGNGVAFKMYPNFPDLNIQISRANKFMYTPCWNNNITYSDEYRRGFDCREDLYTPGSFSLSLKSGDAIYVSVSTLEENPKTFSAAFKRALAIIGTVDTNHGELVRSGNLLVTEHNGRKKIEAGFSWLLQGLLRETLQALPGLALYGQESPAEFEEILDNLIADEQERLFRKTTQAEAPFLLTTALQAYIEYGADEKKVYEKYGQTLKDILDSYLPGERKEIAMQPNGLLWAQQDGVALSWMNAYVDGRAVTERAGYQVETNAFWYNAICFILDLEKKYGSKTSKFLRRWADICTLVKENYQKTFWNDSYRCLADYVDNAGQHMDIRPNQLYAIALDHSPIDEELAPYILRVVDNELVTARGIRTLSPRDARYRGVYEGSQVDRDLAYHQGCAHPVLLDPYVRISFKVKGPAFWKKCEWLTEGFFKDLSKHGVAAFSEIYDGDPPHEPHGAISSALSTAALLTVDYLMAKNKEA